MALRSVKTAGRCSRPIRVLELSSQDVITLARRVFKAGTIEHRYVPARVSNQSGFLQRACDDADGLTPDAEHDTKEFVTQLKLLSVHSIVRLQ
jgi:hypothetical protein